MRNFHLCMLAAIAFAACSENENENKPATRSDYEKTVARIEYTDIATGDMSIDEFRYSEKGVLSGYSHRSSSEQAGIEPIKYTEDKIVIPEKRGADAMSMLQYMLDDKGICESYAYSDGMRPQNSIEIVYRYENERLYGCSLTADDAVLKGSFSWTEGNLTSIEYNDGNDSYTIELSYGTLSNTSSTNMDLNWTVTGHVLGGSLLMPFVKYPWAPMLRLCANSSSASLVNRIVGMRNGVHYLSSEITWATDSDKVPTEATVLIESTATDSTTKLKFGYR